MLTEISSTIYTETRLSSNDILKRENDSGPHNPDISVQMRSSTTSTLSFHVTMKMVTSSHADAIPKPNAIAIPYNGEEVYLHWANRDQYYVKSGEYFSVYRFKSRGIIVTFDLRNIDVEKDNVQGAKRFFIPLSVETTYSSETAEISIPLEYRPLTDEEKPLYGKQKQQDKINEIAETQILQRVSSDYKASAALEQRIGKITVLKKHLDTYTRRNTSDFFIHKDLKGFLNRELDVYIKNEVIPLSDFILMDENLGWFETAKLVHDIAYPNYRLPLPY